MQINKKYMNKKKSEIQNTNFRIKKYKQQRFKSQKKRKTKSTEIQKYMLRSQILGSVEITKTNEANLRGFCTDTFFNGLCLV